MGISGATVDYNYTNMDRLSTVSVIERSRCQLSNDFNGSKLLVWQNLEKVQKTQQQLFRVVHIFFNSRAETHLFPEIFNFTGHKRNTFNGTSRVVIFKIEGWNLAKPLSSLLSNDTSMYQNSRALSIKKIFKHLHTHMAVQFLRPQGKKSWRWKHD